MGAAAAMFIDNLSVAADSTTTDISGGAANIDTYTYDVDLTSGDGTFTLSGDFEFAGPPESSYIANPSSGFPGTLTFDTDNGQFTYTVSLAEVVASGITTHDLGVTGFADGGSVDFDEIFFNFTVCFGEGTAIATPEGEVAVEHLKPGDTVLTADGRAVSVKFVWQTTVVPMFDPADRLEPVLIRAGAFGDTPKRDLVVTADHGMVLDGLVINASALVGQPGVEWLGWKALGARFSYYHVETEAHDVILAEGAATETYLDVVARASFDDYQDYLDLYGAEQTIAENPLPRISSARLLPSSLVASMKGAA